ncbi:ProQ/FINO family protein [Parendozoicomonas haliclonae]|uniref:ProP expression regulator n=1 Tax=Parendozoicomonas haliclonae TaxID=1960125 RepID=A0A1X7AI36_9GAMM|nr:ProQ/FINO family protein [Parendozoicomonas haliclonae]SMA42843.1 ProP expression regulator [Parendozoicomonas haliclonae]
MQSVPHPENQNQQPETDNSLKNKEAHQLIEDLSARSDKDIMGHEAVRILRLLWPEIFRVSSPRPLKIGIDKDILATGLIPDRLLKIGLRCFTRLDQYLEATRTGRARIGLDGQSDGRVRLDEAVNADLMLYSRWCRQNPPRAFIGQLKLVKTTPENS